MQLLLSSNGGFITEQASDILPKNIEEYNIAYVTTASQGVDDLSYMEVRKKRFDELGMNYEEIDIEGKNKDGLKKIFADKDCIYVEGGNTFYLMKAVKESGFDVVLKELLDKGVLYIGSSAGAYICCPNIQMATRKTNRVLDKYGLKDLSGMNLVPFQIFVHYDPKYDDILKKEISNSDFEVKVLKDGQAIYVDDEEVKFVGEGEEIIFLYLV